MRHSSAMCERPPVIRRALRYGTATTIPDFDVSRLVFYLKCCIIGCGMDTNINLRLLDYSNAHQFPGQLQYLILQLVLKKFSLERLINRAIFLDDHHKLLPSDISNAFFAIESASNYFDIEPQSPLAEGTVQVRKVMVCTTQWINEIYIQSISSLQRSFKNNPSGLIKPRKTLHCFHCSGLDARCTCEAGCPPLCESHCLTIHRGVTCSDCAESYISGSRYRCRVCSDCNLCELCYENGEHDQTHAFEKISRTNIPPELLGARAFPLTADDDELCDIKEVPIAVALPIETATPCIDE
jgi:hypothetical protein